MDTQVSIRMSRANFFGFLMDSFWLDSTASQVVLGFESRGNHNSHRSLFGFGLNISVSGKNGCKWVAAETSSMVLVVLELPMLFSLIEWRTFPVLWQSI